MSSQVRVTTRPLKERLLNASVRSPATSKSTAATQFCSRMKYKQYDESKLYQAYRDVIEGKLSTRRAALECGVPLSTLSDRLTGKVQFGKKGGAEKYLTDSEELELKNFIVKLAALGFGFGRKEIIALVQDLLDKRGVNKTITHGWWDGFRRRHPDIVLRQPEPISKVRYMAFNSEIIESYFKELECTLLDNDILEQPSLIFNMDETGFPLNPKSTFVACKRGEKHPSFITSGGKSHITVLACCSASGNAIPPLVIFEGKIFKEELAAGEIPGTMYALSKSGWIDSEIFDLWFTDHFLPHAPGGGPILLLLDGHSSHYNPETINRAAEEKIIIFCLPPHTSHRTQPLDKGCFSPLKSCWREECHTYLRNNPGKIITRFQFSTIFARAWMRSMSMKNITSGFKTTGIYPFNPRALQPEVEKVSPLFNPASLCEKTGINYIPYGW